MIRRLHAEDADALQVGYRIGSLRECIMQMQSLLGELKLHSLQVTHGKGVTRLVVYCKSFCKSDILPIISNPLWDALCQCSQSLTIIAESTALCYAMKWEWPAKECKEIARAQDQSQVQVTLGELFGNLPVRHARLQREQEWRDALQGIPNACFNGQPIINKPVKWMSEEGARYEVALAGNQPELKMPPPTSLVLTAKPLKFRQVSKGHHSTVQVKPSDIPTLSLIGQFNREFIVCWWPRQSCILLFDQHAVHERIRLERLVKMGKDFTASQEEACRGAIKFGQTLSMQVMQGLLTDLAGCKHPFICAHGRPSVHPLLKLS